MKPRHLVSAICTIVICVATFLFNFPATTGWSEEGADVASPMPPKNDREDLRKRGVIDTGFERHCELGAELEQQLSTWKRRHQTLMSDVSLVLAARQGSIFQSSLRRTHPFGYSCREEALIRLAGELRAVDCTESLLNRITEVELVPAKRPYPPSDLTSGRAVRYPAFEALGQIGYPAHQMILKRLPEAEAPLARELMTRLLHFSLGEVLAKKRLTQRRQQWLEKESSEAAVQRIDEALRQLEKMIEESNQN